MILDHQGKPMNPTSTVKPWYAQGSIAWGGNPFSSMGLEYCPRCKLEEDTNTEATHRGGIYVYRKLCKRCGYVIMKGAYQVPLIYSEGMPSAMFEWISTPGKDRR